jgi:hypothetical protein
MEPQKTFLRQVLRGAFTAYHRRKKATEVRIDLVKDRNELIASLCHKILYAYKTGEAEKSCISEDKKLSAVNQEAASFNLFTGLKFVRVFYLRKPKYR